MKKLIIGLTVFLLTAVLSACGVSPSGETIQPSSGLQSPSAVQTQSVKATPGVTPEVKEQAGAPLITPEEAYASMKEVVLLDVRTTQEYEEKHIPGAYLIPVDEIAARAAAELPKDIPLYVYCRTGRRSALAATELLKLGYTVFDLGGIVDWPYETAQGVFEQWDLNSVDFACSDAADVTAVDLLDGVELIPDDAEAEMPDLCGVDDECEP